MAAPLQVTLELTPQARLDVIDVSSRVAAACDRMREFPRCLYYSFHTTAGYLDQALAKRLTRKLGIQRYIELFGTVFPERAGYRHDQLDARTELSSAEREVEPLNADSHLAFIAAGLHTCVSYVNDRVDPVCFIDLDGVAAGRPRQRRTSVIGYGGEEELARIRLPIPVSKHPVDSVNLKDPRLGVYDQLSDLVAKYGVEKGRILLRLSPSERHAGLTVNEYETLLMRHDLAQVLRDPLRFMAEKGRHMLADPRAIPTKTLGYAKYDFVRTLNEFFDALGLNESFVERVISRAIGVPAARFLRMKRSVSLLVSDEGRPGRGRIVEGRYQSPILVQWRGADSSARSVDIALTRFV